MAAGLPVSLWLTRWLASFGTVFAVPLTLDLSPDARVLVGCALAGVGTGVLVAILPAVRAMRADVVSGLKGGWGPGPAGRRVTLRDAMVAVQVACSLVGLVCAVSLAGSFARIRNTPLGYDPRNVLLASIETLSARLGTGESMRLYQALLAELRAQPVRGVALASAALPTSVRIQKAVTPEGAARQETAIDSSIVSDGYFETLGMRIEAGRGFLASDGADSRRVVVLNRSAANLLWPGENPIGRRIRIRGAEGSREVVGVAEDARYHTLTESLVPYLFLPLTQEFTPQVTIHVRTTEDPMAFAPAVRRTVARLAKGVPVSGVHTASQQVEAGLSQIRLAATATAAAGFVGTALALAGLFALAAYRVAQQRQQIALRIALGADPRRIMVSFAAQGLFLGVAGAAAGVAPGIWASARLAAALEGAGSPGATTFAIVIAMLLLAVIAISLIAVRQVLSVQPAAILRVQ